MNGGWIGSPFPEGLGSKPQRVIKGKFPTVDEDAILIFDTKLEIFEHIFGDKVRIRLGCNGLGRHRFALTVPKLDLNPGGPFGLNPDQGFHQVYIADHGARLEQIWVLFGMNR